MRRPSVPKLLAALFALNAVLIGAWQVLRRRAHRTRGEGSAWSGHVAQSAPEPIDPSLEPVTPIYVEPAAAPNRIHRFGAHLFRSLSSLEATLFGAGLAAFGLTRLIGLENFPIYFFTDEAIQTVLAADFVRDGFRDYSGTLFPTFFPNYSYFNLSTSVYLQVLPYMLVGQSLFVTRAMSVLVTFTGMIAVGLILRDIFKIRFWWLGVLLLSITPAWFLHTRTAFETVLATTFYIWSLHFYLRYRQGKPRSLYAAIVFAALTFYTYSAIQLVVLLTGLVMLVSDLRTHWQQRRAALAGFALAILLALPYVRFQQEHPNETFLHARRLDSYWFQQELSPSEKIGRFAREYAFGLSPAFWYAPDNNRDLIRHRMKGYGNILWITMPFMLSGVLIALGKLRLSEYRTLLAIMLLAPAGAALVEVHVTRAMVFVVPAALLTAIGLASVLERLSRRLPDRRLAIAITAALIVVNFAMLADALQNGPTWYSDYHLGGLQFGAKEVFAEIRDDLRRSPDTRIFLSPTWANGTDTLLRFFLPDTPRVDLLNIDAFALKKLPLDDQTILVMTPQEYAEALANPKFVGVRVEKTIPYPDGNPGFYFVRLRYSPEADAIFAAELAARRQPLTEEYSLDGQLVTVTHTQIDVGQLSDLFDRDTFTLVRTMEINPFVIEILFPQPRPIKGLSVTTGSMEFALTATLYTDESSPPREFTQTYLQMPPDPTVQLAFATLSSAVRKIRIEIKDIHAGDESYVHIREITLH